MKCDQAQEWFGLVWDLPEDDPERLIFEAHLAECDRCAEEFRIWEESETMLRRLQIADAEQDPDERINRSVMERIYEEDFWLLPVKDRTYRWSESFRRGVAAAMACDRQPGEGSNRRANRQADRHAGHDQLDRRRRADQRRVLPGYARGEHQRSRRADRRADLPAILDRAVDPRHDHDAADDQLVRAHEALTAIVCWEVRR